MKISLSKSLLCAPKQVPSSGPANLPGTAPQWWPTYLLLCYGRAVHGPLAVCHLVQISPPICGSEQKEDQLFLHNTVCDYFAVVSSATIS